MSRATLPKLKTEDFVIGGINYPNLKVMNLSDNENYRYRIFLIDGDNLTGIASVSGIIKYFCGTPVEIAREGLILTLFKHKRCYYCREEVNALTIMKHEGKNVCRCCCECASPKIEFKPPTTITEILKERI